MRLSMSTGLMADPKEPTNEQLARFLVVYAQTKLGTQNLQLDAPVLQAMMDDNEEYRQSALKTHRRFQQQIDEMFELMQQGRLGCAHIRPNGKHCPNFNEPGSYYCGLHKEADE